MFPDQTSGRSAEELQSYLAAIVDCSDDAIIGVRLDGIIETWNAGAQKLYGYAAAEVLGRPIAVLETPQQPGEIRGILERIAGGETVRHHRTGRTRKDGRQVSVSVTVSPIRDGQGRVVGASAIARDISAQKQAEDAARRTQREMALKTRFATVFLTMPEPEVYEAVLNAVLEHTRCQEGSFGYLDEEGALVLPAWRWRQETVTEETAALWQRALAERQSLIVNEGEWAPAAGIHSGCLLAVPILFQAEAIGLFAIAGKSEDCGQSGREGLERIARDLAPVLKARLERDAQERARRRAEEEVRTVNAELEARVRERTAQLEAANRELEAFAYSVSHDLRAPLRAIHGFSRILMDECATELSEQARHYLDLVRSNVLQMGELIDDLLTLSRLSRQPLEKQPVAPAELAAEAIAGLRQEMNPASEITVGQLPGCEGDPALLKQVFVNLLANALKYSGKRERPRIEVDALPRQNGHATVYYVRDNGAGFDARYAQKLFGVFQRLHRADEYPGTGIGLAIVQRILHRHGGRVWAESELDRGATFYFTMEPEG